MNPWWKDRLEKLRRQDHPQEKQPVLELPQGLPPKELPPKEDDERGIAVIDFAL